MVIENTFKRKEPVKKKVEKIINAGYDVQARIVVSSYDKSMLGGYARYEDRKEKSGTGRFIHEDRLNDGYNALPDSLQTFKEQNVFSSIQLHTREGVLFDGDYRNTDIVAIVKQERCREYTPVEVKFLSDGWEKVGNQMQARKNLRKSLIEWKIVSK